MYKHKLLKNSYKKLNLDFEIDKTKHLYIYAISKYYFSDYAINSKHTYYVRDKNKEISKHSYYYIYKILLWYYYFKYTHKHHLSYVPVYDDNNNRITGRAGCRFNIWKNYFGSTLQTYHQMKKKEGLKLMKRILNRIIINHNGVPKHYSKAEMNKICFIK
jgi:hypothetical protein